MIDFLLGKIVSQKSNLVSIEVNNGIGYCCYWSCLHALPTTGVVKIYIYEYTLSQSSAWYGFCDKLERNLFVACLKTPQIGVTTSLALLRHKSAKAILQAVKNADGHFFETLPISNVSTLRLIYLWTHLYKEFVCRELIIPDFAVLKSLFNLGYKSSLIMKAILTTPAQKPSQVYLQNLITSMYKWSEEASNAS